LISIAIALITLAVVTIVQWAFGIKPALVLILAGFSAVTTPAATVDVLKQSGHHKQTLYETEHIELPFMIFFSSWLARRLILWRSLTWDSLAWPMWYAAERTSDWRMDRCGLGRCPRSPSHLLGPALLRQAGVSIGMALITRLYFPHWKDQIMALIVGSAVASRIIGPIATLWAVRKSVRSGL
jgi:hypothetical protein